LNTKTEEQIKLVHRLSIIHQASVSCVYLRRFRFWRSQKAV